MKKIIAVLLVSLSAQAQGLQGVYFKGTDLGVPAKVRVDKELGFDWETKGPFVDFPRDNFSVRWSGQLLPEATESFTFTVEGGDGVRLWVEDSLILDSWSPGTASQRKSQPIPLWRGIRSPIKLEYFVSKGSPTLKLLWQSASVPLAPIPTLRFSVDKKNAPVVEAGPFTDKTQALFGQDITFTATVRDPLSRKLDYLWTFGDGKTVHTTEPRVSKALQPLSEHYGSIRTLASVQIIGEGGSIRVETPTVLVHHPLPALPPTNSSTILHDDQLKRVWAVNSDNNSVSVFDSKTHNKLFQIPVGKTPKTLAQNSSSREIWVANHASWSIDILDPSQGAKVGSVELPYASKPFGVSFSPDGKKAIVSLQALGKIVKIDAATRRIEGSLDLFPTPRGIAISASGQVFVTRFISQNSHGEVAEVDLSTLTVKQIIPLAFENTLELEDDIEQDNDQGRGLPTYISSLTISPDGRHLWVPGAKANIARGMARDGKQLNEDTTIRSILMKIDIQSGKELFESRIDLNDTELPNAITFSHLGALQYVSTQGINRADVRLPGETDDASGIFADLDSDEDLAPQGLCLNEDESKLFVHYFMSRSIGVFKVGNDPNKFDPITTMKTVDKELLAPEVLKGKQIFYNSGDTRMSLSGYISCATCHLDGATDNRVWDFTDRGEGLRNTTTLLGKRGTGHGRVHWSANFDEIQDFENDIRGNPEHGVSAGFGGLGFMEDADFNFETRNTTLGTPKAGISPELDALAAYLESLNSVDPSPYRNQDGSMTSDALAGKKVFQKLECAECHSGPEFTDSPSGKVHDVGTYLPTSGKRLGENLPGFDTPTLLGIWETPPYFHDGRAETLEDVIEQSGPKHGNMKQLPASEKRQLVAYLKQLGGVTIKSDGSSIAIGDGIGPKLARSSRLQYLGRSYEGFSLVASAQESLALTVYDSHGKTVASQKSHGLKLHLSMQAFPQGWYMVEAKVGSSTLRKAMFWFQ